MVRIAIEGHAASTLRLGGFRVWGLGFRLPQGLGFRVLWHILREEALACQI